jgi:hypothetical protein
VFARGGGALWPEHKNPSAKVTELDVVLPGIVLHGHRQWWGRRWRVVGTSPRPWPEMMTLYVARDRFEHGYWRDVPIDDEPFDRDYFIYCDHPALARVLLGPATRHALDAAFDPASARTLTLHVYDDTVETESIVTHQDPDAAARHVHVHRAFAADAARLSAFWVRLATALGAVITRAWPLQMSLDRPIGRVEIELRWLRPTSPAAAEWNLAAQSLATVVKSVDLRGDAPGWRLEQVAARTPSAVAIAGRWLAPRGEVPGLAELVPELAHMEASGVACDADEVAVAVSGVATEARIADALALLERLAGGESRGSPYR